MRMTNSHWEEDGRSLESIGMLAVNDKHPIKPIRRVYFKVRGIIGHGKGVIVYREMEVWNEPDIRTADL